MSDDLISREEALGGLPAGRASALLFLIESRTAHMVARSQAMEVYLTEEAAHERDLAFLEAFALGREPPLRPTIQDLERHAPKWAVLVPVNPTLRAAFAHLLAQKYRFTSQAVPGTRAALGLDEEVVQGAYQRLYGKPLETIFAPRVTPADRLRWVTARLAGWVESRPPFWTACLLTVTLSLSQTLLALPIAVAGVGPLASIVLILMLGAVNILTMASMAEAIGRNGAIRYGRAFIGRVASDFLGSAGSLFLTLATVTRVSLTVLATYIGLAATLANFTPIPAAVWAALLFFVGLYLLARKSINFSLGLVVLLGTINICLVMILSLLAFAHARLANLLYVNVPFLDPHAFDLSPLQRVFGVILMAYIGSTYVIQCAKVVLPRDPSARSLIWGSVAGTAGITVLLSIWTLAVNGAIAPQVLARLRGTVLPALATELGPSVNVFGSLLVMLLLGMAWIRQSSFLFALVRERLPARSRPIVMLPRRRGQLLFHPRGKPRSSPQISLTYLGLDDGQPRFRIDVRLDGMIRQVETAMTGRWDAAEVLDRLPDMGKGAISLALELLDARRESVHLRVSSPMTLTYEGEWDATGLHMADVLTLPDPSRQLVNWMMRRGAVSLTEVATHTSQGEEVARTMLDGLMEQGFVERMEREGESRYRTHLAIKRGHRLPVGIWQALDKEVKETADAGYDQHRSPADPTARRALERLSEPGRFFLCTSPELVVFLLTEWLFLTGAESFTGVIGFAGVIGNSLLAGIFPVLLLASSRRKGEIVPGVVYRILGNPVLITGIYFFFLANLFLHGLLIWQSPLERAAALSAGMLVLCGTIAMVRRGAFAPRAVVEVREDQRAGGRAFFAITVGGQPAPTEVRLAYPEGEQHCQAAGGEVPALTSLRYAIFGLPTPQAKELKVWAHRVTLEGDSEALPSLLEVNDGNKTTHFDLKLSRGQVLLPLTSNACWLKLTLSEASPA